MKGNKLLIVLLASMCLIIFYLSIKINNPLNVGDVKKGCARTEPYKNLPEFERILNLIKHREKQSLNSNAYKIAPFPILPSNIYNCVHIQYADAKEQLGAEGYFIFDPGNANKNYLPIYVDKSYKGVDDLLITLLVVHELTHAAQFVELIDQGSTKTCMEKEIEAFYMQFVFYVWKTTGEELDHFYPRFKTNNNPQLQILQGIFNLVIPAAGDGCANQCLMDVARKQIREMVYSSKYYQKQCAE